MDVITATTILTTNHSMVLLQLSSGNLAMIEYQLSVGDVLIATLLTVLVVMQTVQVWSNRR
jgi:hypothetical protein